MPMQYVNRLDIELLIDQEELAFLIFHEPSRIPLEEIATWLETHMKRKG